MAISKNKKKEIYDDVKKAIAGSKSVVFVNFHGVTVGDATTMRKQLRKEGIGYTVAKKTIAKKALTDAGITGTLPTLDGELGLAYAADLIAPAREVYDFQKKLDNKISILGGVFDGAYMDKEAMMGIALIPPQKTLYAQVVNLINSPIQGIVMAFDQIAKKKEGSESAPVVA